MAKLIDFKDIEGDPILINENSFQSFGYGIISQRVTKNKNISLQSKGVYAYLVSCAGNDKQTYPTQSKICEDLGIGKPFTLRRYITELQKEGFVKIIKTTKGNLFYRNVYLIADDTLTQDKWKNEFLEGKEFEEEVGESVDKIKKDLAAVTTKPNKKNINVNQSDVDSIAQEVATSQEVNLNNIDKDNKNLIYLEQSGVIGLKKIKKSDKKDILNWDINLLIQCVEYVHQNCDGKKFSFNYIKKVYENPVFKNEKLNKKPKNRFHNTENESFRKYDPKELELGLRESQKGKFTEYKRTRFHNFEETFDKYTEQQMEELIRNKDGNLI
jgi:hypothetical protein